MKYVPLLSHKVAVGGIIGAFISLWLGAYTMHLLPNDHWAMFALYITWCCLFIVSVLITIAGFVEHEKINAWAREHLDDR